MSERPVLNSSKRCLLSLTRVLEQQCLQQRSWALGNRGEGRGERSAKQGCWGGSWEGWLSSRGLSGAEPGTGSGTDPLHCTALSAPGLPVWAEVAGWSAAIAGLIAAGLL